MKRKVQEPLKVMSISALHNLLNIEKPSHPLISIVNLTEIKSDFAYADQTLVYPFYAIALLKEVNDRVKYGQQHCDFNGGIMTFAAPRQLINVTSEWINKSKGYLLIIHPDYLQPYPLAKEVKKYGFFSYKTIDALHLSSKEELLLTDIIKNINLEVQSNNDVFTHDVIISYIGLLLNYTNRFYNRQFLARESTKSRLIFQFDTLLKEYLASEETIHTLPSVQCIASKLNLSPNYLSDILRVHTGLSTQQHIHSHLIDKAKEILSTTTLSVSEIAYHLGFGYPQSFNKLFKSKTNLSPLEYRNNLQESNVSSYKKTVK